MKVFNKVFAAVATLSLGAAMLFSFGGIASAACWQYTGSTTSTSDTPVFNNICGAPGIGNESNFVRIRPNTTGDPTSTSNNAAYVDSLNSACNVGDKFDIHTYIHNNANAAKNDNGAGSAVAHGVQLSLAAPINTVASNYTFSSTITATNAPTAKDTATLNCSNGPVKLTLVPKTVQIYGTQYDWTALSDSVINNTFKIGSPTAGSGDVWGCWQYRLAVVYEVQVEKLPPQEKQATATCDMLSIIASDNRRVKVSQFKYTSENASVKNVVLNWGDNSPAVTLTNANQVVGQEHTYSANGTYNITAVITFLVNDKEVTSGGAGTACAAQVVFKPGQPPTVTPPPPTTTVTTPPPTTTVTTPPSQLVNTGPGSVAAMFGAVTAAGALAHRKFLSRRLGQ
jgi:hypothetical protein